jgi:hypothetical protein
MEELYIEGLAIHDGPESCVGDPRGRSEALTGVRAGWPLSLVINRSGVPTLFFDAEGNTGGGAFASRSSDPAGSKNPCMRVISPGARTGRSHGHPSVVMVGRVARGRLRP